MLTTGALSGWQMTRSVLASAGSSRGTLRIEPQLHPEGELSLRPG
jgi:hypothetical protein